LFEDEYDSQGMLSLLSGTFKATQKANNASSLITKSQPNLNLFDNSELLSMLSGKFDTQPSQATQKKSLEVIEEVVETEDKSSDRETGELSDTAEPAATGLKLLQLRQAPALKPAQPKSKFIEGEAEVEEDEFMNYGGIDGEDFAGIDEYEKDMLADGDKTKVNEKAIQELHRCDCLTQAATDGKGPD
jgi:MRC1-like domain